MQQKSTRPLVMGILNVTPDSFSDGGRASTHLKMKQRIEAMINEGADLIDIGGESTRPGADPVSLDEELERILPAIEYAQSISDLEISVDTYKTEVMQEVLSLGVSMINDVNALQANGAVDLVAKYDAKVCLMHRRKTAQEMQLNPVYNDVVKEVSEFLMNRVSVCLAAGIEENQIILDPGFGFDKALRHNVALFKHLEELTCLGYPLLVGVSRKRMIGEMLGNFPVEQRMMGSVSAAIVAMTKGADILRVHDVAQTVQAVKIAEQLL